MLVSGAARSPVGAPALSVWTMLRRTGFFLLPTPFEIVVVVPA